MKHIPLRDRLFEVIDDEMYIFMKAIGESGLSCSYYRNVSSEGGEATRIHPKNKKYILVKYECIKKENQDKIVKRYGCTPYEYLIREPILRMVQHDNKADEFFAGYSFTNGNKIPLRRVMQYTRAAGWLNMLTAVIDEGNRAIKDMNVTVPVFYQHVKELILLEKKNGASESYEGSVQLAADFPASYGRLLLKVKEYKEKGYELLIDKNNENRNAAKVKDEVSETQLLVLLEDPRQLDDVMVAMMYNLWAKENGYEKISPSTVGVWRRKSEHSIIMGREGNGAFNEKYIREVKGLRPSIPLALVEHDDNNLDFLFSDSEGYDYNKYVAICVVDSRTKLLLGKSYTMAQSPQQWMIQHAWLDAMYYIRSLTGGWYLPHELKADKWAQKSLTPFYQSIGKFVTPGHGNKHRGYIEPFFRKPLWKRAQQLVSKNNWTGNNMSAKYRGVNEDMLRNNQSNRPMVGQEAEVMIENFFHLLRHMPDAKRSNMAAVSKEQEFVQEWNQLHADDKRPITDEKFLLTFGVKHEPQGRQIMITNRGVEPQIDNAKYSYDLPELWMYERYIGAKVNVVYDPFDMSRVLVTNYDDIRFIAHTAQLAPRALKDQYTGSRTYLNAILSEKKYQVETAGRRQEQRRKTVDSSHYNAEALLQGGVLIKEVKNSAEQKMLEDFTSKRENFLDSNNDFSEYFNG